MERGGKSEDFVVRLVGSDMKPWKVPLRTLARVMDAIQRLVEQTEAENPEDSASDSKVQPADSVLAASEFLRLVGVRTASAGYVISAAHRGPTLKVLSATGRAIDAPEESEWTGPTLSSLKDLSEVARSLGVRIEIREPNSGGRLGDVIAKIRPETYDSISDSAFVRGDTSLYGTIERIGGASEARCAFRLPEETKLIYCGIDGIDLARKLGKFLYEDVSVFGEATWLRANWQIRSFKIRSFEEPKTGSIRDAMRDIWKSGGKAWDKIADPTDYISKLRKA